MADVAKEVKDADTGPAAVRSDFIKRIFAVAISVGFAATLSNMRWISLGQWPSDAEIEQIMRLLVAFMATVLSWEGYFVALDQRPLNGLPRFIIDVTLVFLYMIFLITTNNQIAFMPILSMIFGLYFIWDVLTIREHLWHYDKSVVKSASHNIGYGNVVEIYILAAKGRAGISRGPLITFVWAIYIVLLLVMSLAAETTRQSVLVTCFGAFLGLTLYRVDKQYKFGMNLRLLAAAGSLSYTWLLYQMPGG